MLPAISIQLGLFLQAAAVIDIDAYWGQGIIDSDQFVQIVYLTL